VAQGCRVRISGTQSGGSAVRQRLLDMGVTRGTELLVERWAPLGDPIEILIKGYHLAIRRAEAACIEVEECEETA
jgi:Fe2+ transport system protein FeoA